MTLIAERPAAPRLAAEAAPAPSRRVPGWIWPLGIAVVAVGLRVWQLDRVGFNSDEVVYSSQAAVLAGDRGLAHLFPVFRAHPLVFQTLLSLLYRVRVDDTVGRLTSVAFGLGTVVAGGFVARVLYGRRVALVTAGILAAMPYLVVVNRQVLLDGPMTFFATVTLGCLAVYGRTHRPSWLYATAAGLGLTFLTKETALVLAVSVAIFLALAHDVVVRTRRVVVAGIVLGVVMLTAPVSLLASNSQDRGGQYLIWQVLRRPNHGLTFYFEVVPPVLGFLVVALAALGLVALRRERSWRDTLLLAWVAAPLVFFVLWPTKGYQYLLPIAVPMAILAARPLARIPTRGRLTLRGLSVPAAPVAVLVAVVVGLSLVVPAWRRVDVKPSSGLLAGAGGTPGGRETGHWIAAHVPRGVQILTIGPSMANIVQYYGRRKASGLSVSPNPLHRNPVYDPVRNPDRLVREGDAQYLVWDVFSAGRSRTFEAHLRALVRKYQGHPVHTERVGHRPVVVVYQVRPA